MLVHELEQTQIECSKVLIYVRDYQWCSAINHLFKKSLGDKAYYPPCAKHQKIEWLPCTTVTLLQVFKKLSWSKSTTLMEKLVATPALGMGVDIEGLHRIINCASPVILNRTYKNVEGPKEMPNSQKLFLCPMTDSFITETWNT